MIERAYNSQNELMSMSGIKMRRVIKIATAQRTPSLHGEKAIRNL